MSKNINYPKSINELISEIDYQILEEIETGKLINKKHIVRNRKLVMIENNIKNIMDYHELISLLDYKIALMPIRARDMKKSKQKELIDFP